MKTKILILAISSLCCNGCSFFIAESGKDVAELKTREQVRKEFGEPLSSSTEDGKDYDDFHSRRKIANESRGNNYQQALALTLGLGEFLTFPAEIYETGRDLVVGENIRFYYDRNGRTWECLVNGEHPYVDDPYIGKPRD